MKPQDILFLLALGILFIKHKTDWFIYAGLACLALSIPLFAKWIFFTAERLTWYAAAFFLTAVFMIMKEERNKAIKSTKK